MERTKMLQQIYLRLASLEEQREETRLRDETVTHIDLEMNALRLKLQDVMNSPCPIIKDVE